jgi:hypothetical protein
MASQREYHAQKDAEAKARQREFQELSNTLGIE